MSRASSSALIVLAAMVMLIASACGSVGGSSPSSPRICDGFSEEVGGCDPDRPSFQAMTCEGLGREAGQQLDERLLALYAGPETVNNEIPGRAGGPGGGPCPRARKPADARHRDHPGVRRRRVHGGRRGAVQRRPQAAGRDVPVRRATGVVRGLAGRGSLDRPDHRPRGGTEFLASVSGPTAAGRQSSNDPLFRDERTTAGGFRRVAVRSAIPRRPPVYVACSLRPASHAAGVSTAPDTSIRVASLTTGQVLGILAMALSLPVTAVIAVDEYFRYGDRYSESRLVVERLRVEGSRFASLADVYVKLQNHQSAFPVFMTRVEDILEHDVEQWVALATSKVDADLPTQGSQRTPGEAAASGNPSNGAGARERALAAKATSGHSTRP